MPFEQIIRPYQTPDSFGRTIIPSVPSARSRATLTWGAKTTVSDVVPERTGINVDCCKETASEVEKLGHTYKISSAETADLFIMQHRTTQIKLQKDSEDSCASDLDQISGVASGIKEAFADLKADIEAGGAGKSIKHCGQYIHLNPE